MCFLLLQEKKKDKTNDNWNLWIWAFGSKNGHFVTHNCFSKMCSLKPLFYRVLGVLALWARLSKKGNFGHPPKKEKVD